MKLNKVDDKTAYENLLVKYAELEKENEKLKKFLFCKGECIEQIEQLTKAKELLKEAQGYIENIDDEGDELYDKIEQFLKEIEK